MKLILCLLMLSNPLWAQEVKAPSGVASQTLIKIKWESDWQLLFPNLKIGFIHQTRPGYLAQADFDPDRIFLWIRPNQSALMVAKNLLHEIAHFFERRYMTLEQCLTWQDVRGIQNSPWYKACDLCTDFDSGAGDFAESVSWTFLGGDFHSWLGPVPTPEQQQLLLGWIKTAQGR